MYWGERMLDVAARARCWTCRRADQVRRRGAEATDEGARQRRCANAADQEATDEGAWARRRGQGGTWPSTVSMRAVCARKGAPASARGPRPGTALPRERDRERESHVTRGRGADLLAEQHLNVRVERLHRCLQLHEHLRTKHTTSAPRRPRSRRRDGWQGPRGFCPGSHRPPPCRADGCAWSLVPGVHGGACAAGGRIGTCLSSSVTAPPSCEAFL